MMLSPCAMMGNSRVMKCFVEKNRAQHFQAQPTWTSKTTVLEEDHLTCSSLFLSLVVTSFSCMGPLPKVCPPPANVSIHPRSLLASLS